MQIEQANSPTVTDLWSEVEPSVLSAACLEEGAQTLAAALYDHFAESVVQARVFVTVPFSELPETNRQFVRNLVDSANGTEDLKDTTPVLSLVGTDGVHQDWRDRRQSTDHVGIPLVSSSFVNAIPMISRLLKEMGVPLDWADSHDSAMIVNSIGSAAGLFFVEDAATTTDAEGRHIITAQDFVSDYQVKSVFGVGGVYAMGQIAVIVTFCREHIPRSVAERFISLAAFFISSTTGHMERGEIFQS